MACGKILALLLCLDRLARLPSLRVAQVKHNCWICFLSQMWLWRAAQPPVSSLAQH
jgi:hypothetical protein